MKKNLKFVSAAAAALLTVAPVVATAVTPAATVFADGNNSGDVQANAINVNVNAPASTTVDVTAKVADYLNSSSFPVATSLGTANVSKVTLTQNDAKKTPVAATDSFQNTWIYNQSATVQLSGLQAGKWYNVNGTVFQANAQGVEPDNAKVTVTRQLTAIDSALPGNPYFTNKQNQVIYSGIVSVPGDGVVVDGAITLDSVLTAAKNQVNFVPNSAQNQNGWITTTTADVKAQLENQGIKVAANGSFTAPANGFYVSLTGYNQANGKTASVKVPFAPSNADYSSYPLITIGKTTAQGTKVNGKISTQTVKVGDKTFTGTEGVKAQVNKTNKDELSIFVTSNNVNVNVPGTYSVTLSATNPAGLTTTVTRTVVVTASGLNGTINYVPGYAVNVWNVYGNQVAYANKKLATGTPVKTFDTKTVDGVSYTRLNSKDSNEWVQTQYLDGSWNQNSNTSSNSSAQAGKEEAMSGVIVVKYNGLGGVNLLNNKGQYQDQYVKNGSAFKVFGKMTLNGKTYYRLGTQNQWIPAQYAVIR